MSDLNFQNFGLDDSPFTNPNTDRRNPSTVHDASNLMSGNIDLNDDTSTRTEGNGPPGPYIFSLKYYQQFFDVDQEQVYNRLLRSIMPSLKSNFILDHIQPLPDLYGPLWICITFVFSTAICGNLAHYIETHGQDHYENDFGLVTGATTLVASYVILVPFFLRWILWYRQPAISYSYLELLSAYGYSLAVFVPVSILWVLHWHLFRWVLILAAIGIGGLMLFNIVWPAIRSDPNRAVAFAIVGGVLVLHAALGLGFKAYYFDSVIPSQHGIISQPDVLPPAALTNESGKIDEAKPPQADAQVGNPNDTTKIATRDTSDAVKAEATDAVDSSKKEADEVKATPVVPLDTKAAEPLKNNETPKATELPKEKETTKVTEKSEPAIPDNKSVKKSMPHVV